MIDPETLMEVKATMPFWLVKQIESICKYIEYIPEAQSDHIAMLLDTERFEEAKLEIDNLAKEWGSDNSLILFYSAELFFLKD